MPEKPIRLKKKEFQMNLGYLIKSSGLPYYIIGPMLKDALTEVEMAEERIYQREKKEYEESLAIEESNQVSEKDALEGNSQTAETEVIEKEEKHE